MKYLIGCCTMVVQGAVWRLVAQVVQINQCSQLFRDYLTMCCQFLLSVSHCTLSCEEHAILKHALPPFEWSKNTSRGKCAEDQKGLSSSATQLQPLSCSLGECCTLHSQLWISCFLWYGGIKYAAFSPFMEQIKSGIVLFVIGQIK